MRRNLWKEISGILTLFLLVYIYQNLEKVIAIFILTSIAILLYIFLRNYNEKKKYLQSGINDIDKMTGEEFEIYLKHYFQNLGYKAALTSKTNDYGADLILQRNGEIIVIQAKRYSKVVGIKAVQEIIGAMNYYSASKGIVITNNYFSSNANNLAKKSGVQLWDRNTIINRFSKHKII